MKIFGWARTKDKRSKANQRRQMICRPYIEKGNKKDLERWRREASAVIETAVGMGEWGATNTYVLIDL